ncbi:MAG: DNA translocase FtsK 4TM domain-containing protein [Bacteroidaceae bacterium]
MDKKANRKFILGFLLLIFAFCMLVATISYLFTGKADQCLMNDPYLPAQNLLGKMGWRVSRWLMDDTFGVSGIMIPVFLLATGIRITGILKVRLHKWFINCMFIMIWSSAFLACLSQYVTALKDSFLSWGGNIGLHEYEIASAEIGDLGCMVVLICAAILYLFYLSEEAITATRNLVTHTSKDDKIIEDNGNDEYETENSEGPVTCEDMVDSTVTEPFSDNPESTATVLTFDMETNQLVTSKEGDDVTEKSKGENDPTIEIQAEKEEDENTKGEKDGNMTIVVGQEPEKAHLKDDGALKVYDPKKDLEFYKYPTVDLLKHYPDNNTGVDVEEQQRNRERIQEILRNFGVEIVSITATVGPTITLYEIKPAAGVRVSRIRSLEDDIALSLSALGIRIIAPIPGKGTIGIEVPNARPQIVSMESIINSRKFQTTDYELPIALGKTITNEVYMADLAKLPHLLVAGATGQGKSVGLNAIITSLLYKKHPAELKLVMVDPKKVEFSLYNPIVKHFLAQVEGTEDTDEPIITDVNKVIQTLKSLCIEMDQRYNLLKIAHAKNLKEYNQKFRNRQLNPNNGHRFMPYIVVIIDEFGDLIMTAGKEIELPIARIAQLARAVGIHMILATQRPTTNIITGTIKANFPARMAFKVTSAVDSKTILDRSGANHLVGKGDMLIINGNEPIRVQCAFVDTPEVENLVSFIASQQGYLTPFPLPEVPDEGDDNPGNSGMDSTRLDSMFEEAAQLIVSSQRGSTSYIQQALEVGFNRAGRIMKQLEMAGIVGPSKGSKPREVICSTVEELQYKLDSIKNKQ